MRDIGEVLHRIRAFQSKFEGLLASARKRAAAARVAPAAPTRLRELTGFGVNPGNLRMFAYVPEHLPSNAPLVIALHGCTQTADEYDRGTGWSSLADHLGFAVVYPQQQLANNPKNCFSWFLRHEVMRGSGEALSIREMVEHATETSAADRSRVYVTGLSAGGAMASVMLATYPEIFAGGAIIAGLPYGCANNVQQAFEAMFIEQEHVAQVLGDRVRAASAHRGPWPKISVWHGTRDPIVKCSNGEEIIRQWINVHGLSDNPPSQRLIGNHTLRVWSDVHGEAQVEAFSISNMAHGVPLATTGSQCCGATGAFFLDVGISSTHHIARFWGLDEALGEIPRADAPVLTSLQIPTAGRDLAAAGAAAEGSTSSAEASFADNSPGGEWHTRYPLDPKAVIAAAFKAAGLEVSEFPTTQAGTAGSGGPGPIIEAAFKIAGLR